MCKEIEGFPLTKIRKGVYIMFYLGIDIAKVNHVASLIGEDGSILVKAIKFTNSNEGLQKLIESISEYDPSQLYFQHLLIRILMFLSLIRIKSSLLEVHILIANRRMMLLIRLL